MTAFLIRNIPLQNISLISINIEIKNTFENHCCCEGNLKSKFRKCSFSTNLGGGRDKLCDLVQAVQMRNQFQPQVDLRKCWDTTCKNSLRKNMPQSV